MREWRESINSTAKIITMTKVELNEALSRLLAMRKKDGSEYPPNTVHHICCGIMRDLRTEGQPDIDFFKDSSFSQFRDVLDSEMKRLRGQGLGSRWESLDSTLGKP